MAIILCKECGHQVSDQAASCPSCGAPIAVKRAALRREQLALIGAVCAFAVIALAVNQISMNRSRAPSRSDPVAMTPTAHLEPSIAAEPLPTAAGKNVVEVSMRTVYQTTAERLYQDYTANAVAAQSKIANSRVRITGRISAIDEDASGDPVLKLAASSDNSVNVTLSADEIAAAAQLARGQSVEIQCDSVRRIMGAPEGSQCRLVVVQDIAASPTLPAAPAPPASELHGASAAGVPSAARKTHKSLPSTTIAMVPPVPSLAVDSVDASTSRTAETTISPLPVASAVPAAAAISAPAAATAAATPAPTALPSTTSAALPAAISAPVSAPVRVAEAQVAPAPAILRTEAAPETSAAEGSATDPAVAMQIASRPATSSPNMPASDDLARVRADDPQAADHIASYCASSSGSGSGAANCRRDEQEAWTRLVKDNEFPTLNDAARRKCSQPPFPDSYRAKEICAKYELRIY
jgi:hypothetical protein